MSVVALRDAEPQDVETIWALAKQLAQFEHLESAFIATVDDFRNELFGTQPGAHVILAEYNDSVVGMALYVTTFSTFLGRRGIWLEDLFVHPDARRRGVASALLDELRRRSPGRLEWEVLDWNADAISFYEGAGARPFSGWIKYRMGASDQEAPSATT